VGKGEKMLSKLMYLLMMSSLTFGLTEKETDLVTPNESNPEILNQLVQPITYPKVHQSIMTKIEQRSNEKIKVWVFFTDKGIFSIEHYKEALTRAEANLTDRARKRRLKTMHEGALVDFADLLVHEVYIDKVLALGVKHRATSRWLNAISVEANVDQISIIAEFDFVRSIKPVVQFQRTEPPSHKVQAGARDSLDYGPSYDQLEQLNVPAVHQLGYDASGVLICMLDTGFKRTHEALVDVTVVAEWDFINDDGNTSYEPGQDDPFQPWHGTITLSTVGGFEEGHLIGPAYGADFALGKTEDVTDEQPIEEDWWVEGAEWADSLGADIISSSLGYTDWYTYEDMNGDSCVTTIGADEAASKGIIVCNAMGNEGQFPGSLIAPADADSIIAVGAVDQWGNLASFSSIGPTYDGRTKPEVVARGVDTYAANPDNDHGYLGVDGTSLSTPLIAGVAALILGAHPGWTNMEVREAMMMTASQAQSPDNYRGWGIPDVLAALNYAFGIVVDWTEIPQGIDTEWTINSSDNVTVDLGSPGGPQNWNFTTQPMGSDSFHVKIVPKASTPYPDSFPNANLVYKAVHSSDTSYQYQELDSTFLSTLGFGSVSLDTTYILPYDPIDSHPLPIIHGNSNQYHYGFEVEEADTVVKHEWYGRSIIDAWGTVTIPYGAFPCLRRCSFDTCAITTFVTGNPVSGDTVTHIHYTFITEEHNEVVSVRSHPGETNPNYSDAAILERLTFFYIGIEGTSTSHKTLLSYHPNPFSDHITMTFSLMKPGYVNLTIYDVSGRLVTTIIDKHQQQGNYTVTWFGTNESGNQLPNGIYFYHLDIDDTIFTGKMLLIR
jgi:serine protease AprX